MNKMGVSCFSVGDFLSNSAEKYHVKPLSMFQKNWGIENFLHNWDGVTIFQKKN